MAHLHTEPAPRLHAGHVAFTLLPFALAVAFAVFFALAQANPDAYRASAFAWGSTVMAVPALFALTRRLGRRVLTHWWRLFWTFGLILLLAHGVAMLGWQHLWRPDLVAAEFGLVGAVLLWGLEAVWLLDVLMAWNRLDWAQAEGRYAWWQGCVGAFVLVSFALALLLFGHGPVDLVLGVVLLAGVALALLLRGFDREEA